jgi:phosphoserine phosphatase
MNFVATLIAPSVGGLGARQLAAAARELPRARAPVWLNEGEAADVIFAREEAAVPSSEAEERILLRAIAERLRGLADRAPLDCVVQRNDEHRSKKLFLADMDSTMIGQECIDELADFVGRRPEVAAITERAMRGDIAFEPALRERVALLKGLPLSIVDEVIESRITLTPGGKTLVATMRAHGACTALVSGGFTLFTRKVAAMLGFQENRANELLLDGARLSGAVREPILGKQAKLDALLDLRIRGKLDPRATLAVADGANDLAMLGEAGLGVAYRAKPAVASAAQARIDHCDLTALLFAQGYKREEFAGPGP